MPDQPFIMDFPARLHAQVHPQPEGGYFAEVIGLPDCFTEGDSIEELRDNLADALAGWLEAQQELIDCGPIRRR